VVAALILIKKSKLAHVPIDHFPQKRHAIMIGDALEGLEELAQLLGISQRLEFSSASTMTGQIRKLDLFALEALQILKDVAHGPS